MVGAVRNIGLNPHTSQMDATEVLASLFQRINTENMTDEEIQQAVEVQAKKTQEGDPKTPLSLTKPFPTRTNPPIIFAAAHLGIILGKIATKVGSIAYQFLSEFAGGLSSPERSFLIQDFKDTDQFTFQSDLPDERKERMKQRTIIPKGQVSTEENPVAQNPLSIVRKTTTRYTPESDIPDHLQEKAERNWEIRPNESFGESTIEGHVDPYLPLAMEKENPSGPYDLKYMLGHLYNSEEPRRGEIKDPNSPEDVYYATIESKETVTKAPEHLLLSFKRFRYDESGRQVKIHDNVEGITSTLTVTDELITGFKDTSYNLSSFVTHLGGGTGGGHYVAYRKVEDKWFFFNDGAAPLEVSEEKALEAAKRSYLIFYEGVSA